MRYAIPLAFALLGCLAVGCPSPTENLELANKADYFYRDIELRFIKDGQMMCKLKRPTDAQPQITYNMPDNAYMTGIYLGSLAMRYAVTQDPAVQQQITDSVMALDLLCTVSGVEGLLARAAVPLDAPFSDDGEWHDSPDGLHRWRGDVSSDQMDGVFYGFALAYDHGATLADRHVIARNAKKLMDYLLENDLRIIDVDGEPTTWGHYEPDYIRMREPMNALLFLQHLKVTAHVTGDAHYEEVYRAYATDPDYGDYVYWARVMGEPVNDVNYSDDVLLYLAYYPLLRLETDPELRGKYLSSLRRSWEGAEGWPGWSVTGNPLHAFLVHDQLGIDADAGAIDFLKYLPLDMKWTPDTIERYEQRFGFAFDPTVRSPEPAPGAPVPTDRRPRTWSALVQNPYVAGERDPNDSMEYNGHDYLAAYWLGRYLGYIGATW
jgi:hypothetical protein